MLCVRAVLHRERIAISLRGTVRQSFHPSPNEGRSEHSHSHSTLAKGRSAVVGGVGAMFSVLHALRAAVAVQQGSAQWCRSDH